MYRYAEIPFCFRLKTWSYSTVHYRQYSGRRKASFKLSNATICPECSKPRCLDPTIDNALWGLKLNFVSEIDI